MSTPTPAPPSIYDYTDPWGMFTIVRRPDGRVAILLGRRLGGPWMIGPRLWVLDTVRALTKAGKIAELGPGPVRPEDYCPVCKGPCLS